MIFVSGIHGVGKTYFCNIIDERTINDFQEAEKAYEIEIARQLNRSLEIYSSASGLGRIVEIIKTGGY